MKTTDRILDKIKREGPLTAKKLAEDLSMTTMGARQHLQSLEDEGYLQFEDVKVKVGRPTRHWQLTSKGHTRFSDRHGELAIQVLDSVEALFGADALSQVALERENKTFLHYQQALSGCETLAEKLETIRSLRESEGYMAELSETESGFLLVENHCPICKAAERCPSLCQSELNVFQRLLGEEIDISRQEHIIQGERRCSYQINNK
ncbi:metalloregulator ArsR/SmtB family transcription factor [Vibrio sp. SCSIO 43136]|uniref:helix-turn-helix transcriptional regulator n=1 Tax=Vibrio sp. SCSIO 43136 TaxID=2819101 RepID=UPI0020753FCB|nr:metalloregulator ArsR/SmtB family transcription factor [Vibrio sp. SCSIO 43136]USD65470.1 transcriptional regulator [Vibrio sp. SCSIO 43136]